MRASLLIVGCLCLTVSALAADLPPWTPAGRAPLPVGTRSAFVQRLDETIRAAPDTNAARRGTAHPGAYLPIYGSSPGPGCNGRWLLVGALAWLCQDHVELARAQPFAAHAEQTPTHLGTPLDYYFVGRDGSFGYSELGRADNAAPDAQFEPGFALAIAQLARTGLGEAYGLTTKGLWVPMRDLVPARVPQPLGRLFDPAEPARFAWVHVERAHVYSRDGRRIGSTLERLTVVTISAEVTRAGRDWYRIGDNQWLRARDLRIWQSATPPADTRPDERWIDIDTGQQILTAYRGTAPVFATLVSTGRGAKGSALATPQGTFRIWVKLKTSDMDNLENENARRYYSIQDVPWVMYFKKGYGLHGAFWHRSFGRVRSHGCVNLAPKDAEWLFHWAGPRLPAGWSAVLPTAVDRGTLVVVR